MKLKFTRIRNFRKTAAGATSTEEKATHAELFKGLKVHKEVIPLDEEDKVCPVCGSPMERIGEEYVRRELVFTPAKCEVYEYYTESYGLTVRKERAIRKSL